MPSVLIAGLGYVGQPTAALFSASGWDVEGWSRQSSSYPGIRTAAVDISNAAALKRDRTFDVVIQCASTRGGEVDDYQRVYFEGARNLRYAFPSALMIFVSSTSVYAQADGGWVNEDSLASPLRETGKVLRQAEDLVLESGGIVARLAGIHGPGRSFLLRSLLKGTPLQSEDRYVNQVHRDDIASALFLLAKVPPVRATGNTFNVVDDEPILRGECYRWLTQKLGPQPAEPEQVETTRKRGDSNKRVSNARLRAVGWKPRFPTFAIAMEQSILPSFELAQC